MGQRLFWIWFCTIQLMPSDCRPPNVVIYLADDLGYADVSSFGSPTIRTPNIDALARGGMKFTNFYSAYPICTPARSGLLTGRLPVRNGIYSHHDWPLDLLFRVFYPVSSGCLPADEVTLAELLKQANYSSALIGKWHLGHECLPTMHGFDEFYGLPYSQDEGCPPTPCHAWQKIWPGVPLYNNTTIVEQPVNLSTLTPRYNEKALSFIQRNKDRPWLLVMAYSEVHVNLFASKDFLNRSRRGFFGDAAQEMDASIGTITQYIRDLNLQENTLAIFTSDNGAWTDQKLDGGSNGPFLGEKGSTWEGGLRVPTVFYWPGHVPPRKVSVAVGSQLDIFSTVAELANVSLPLNKTLDSHSLLPVILGKQNNSPTETIFYYRAHILMAVRCLQYKAHFFTRSGFGDDLPKRHSPPLLYNVNHDPSEQHPLNATQYADVLATINSIAAEHTKSVGTLPPSQLDKLQLGIEPCCKTGSKKCQCTEH